MKNYLLAAFLLLTGCMLKAQRNMMPEKRPAGFTLYFHIDGGMRYYSETLRITEDSCLYTINNEGRIVNQYFRLSPVQLDELYTVLRNNYFSDIVYKDKGRVYDRGGETMSIGWMDNLRLFSVNDSQSYFVQPEWQQNWNIICNYVRALPARNPHL